LEALRWHIIRSVVAVLVIEIIAFLNKNFVFDTVFLGPAKLDFWTYKQLCSLSHAAGMGNELCASTMGFTLINTRLAGQFMMHISMSFTLGLVLAFPYAAWELWRFFKPALSASERNYTRGIVFASSVLFLSGVAFGYYIITPIAVQFLGNYTLSEAIDNKITVSDYISIVTMTSLSIAIVFELPVVIYFLSKGGLVTPAFLRRHRRHAIVVILIISAILTPSTDMLSQVMVSIPFLLLYELSILVSKIVVQNRERKELLDL
ncbi:MAG: twin-arginine translocase subunit TatC, partial [Bacteroidota bacterium]|nr:twin-arginine translocase subunit TatC [Bacteroidota bacterium]